MVLTSEQVGKLIAALPNCTDARKRRLLPRMLKDWSQIELKQHLARPTAEQVRVACQRIRKTTKAARDLKETLSELETLERFAVASELVGMEDAQFQPFHFEKIELAERRLSKKAEWLERLAAATLEAARTLASPPMRRKTLVRYLILLDLVAIYEWATERKVKRSISFEDGTNRGPFWDFACVAWLILHDTAAGLDYTLKIWAAHRTREAASALIPNMNMRHPTWRICQRKPSKFRH